MAQVGGAVVELDSTGGLVWTFPGSQVVEMSEEDAQRSSFLISVQELLEHDDSRWARVCLPHNVRLPMWLDFVAATESQSSCYRPCTDPEGVLQILLAADFLGDEKTVSLACRILTDLMVKTDQAMQQLPCRSKASASPAENAQNTARKHLWTVGGRIAKYFDRRLPGVPTQGSKGAQKGSTLKGCLSGTGTPSPRARKSKQGIVPDQLAALVKQALPTHLIAKLIKATSGCLHMCLMALPEDFHSLIAEAHHPHTSPAQIAHLTSSQLAAPVPRWTTSEGTLLRLCKEVTSARSVGVLLSTFNTGSYFLLTSSAAHSEPACGPTWPSGAPEFCVNTLKAAHRGSSLAPNFSRDLHFEKAVCCISGADSTSAPQVCTAAGAVADVLPNLRKLQTLELRTPSAQDICRNPCAGQVQRTLELCTGLRSLAIRGLCCEDDSKAESPLVVALLRLDHLTKLALTDQCITSQTLSDLQERFTDPAMLFLPSLVSLDVARNRLWYLGVYPLHSLLNRLTTIEEIDLSESLLGIEIFGRYALSDAFRALTRLRTIRMGNNRLHGEGLRPLARAWSTLRNVEHLDLQYSCVRYTRDIAFSLSQYTGLQFLDLSGATQSDVSSWSILTAALQPLTSLTHLSLRACQLTSAAMGRLVPSIASCSGLLALDLSDNNMLTSPGIQCLSEHLSSFPLLTSLLLSCFDSSGHGARALAAALPSARCLSTVNLAGCCTREREANKLKAAASSIANVTPPSIIVDDATAHPFPAQPLRIPKQHVA